MQSYNELIMAPELEPWRQTMALLRRELCELRQMLECYTDWPCDTGDGSQVTDRRSAVKAIIISLLPNALPGDERDSRRVDSLLNFYNFNRRCDSGGPDGHNGVLCRGCVEFAGCGNCHFCRYYQIGNSELLPQADGHGAHDEFDKVAEAAWDAAEAEGLFTVDPDTGECIWPKL